MEFNLVSKLLKKTISLLTPGTTSQTVGVIGLEIHYQNGVSIQKGLKQVKIFNVFWGSLKVVSHKHGSSHIHY